MSLRYNSVIIEDGRKHLYRHRFSSDVIDRRLFFGPVRAREFISQGQLTQEWLDYHWCEGGCALDVSAQKLVWFGGEGTGNCIRAHWAQGILMQHQWPGWDIEWANDGVYDLMRFAGAEVPDGTTAPVEARPLQLAEIEPVFDNYVSLDFNAVVTCKVDGQTRGALLQNSLCDLARSDLTFEAVFDFVSAFPEEAFFNAQDNLLEPASMWTGYGSWGAHFDADRCETSVWYVKPQFNAVAAIAEQWSGWTVKNCGANFEWQKRFLPQLRWPDTRQALSERIDRLRAGVVSAEEDAVLKGLVARYLS